MKKKIVVLLSLLLILTTLVLPVSAKNGQVLDYAAVMMPQEASSLGDSIRAIRDSHGLDIVILTVPNLMNIPIEQFADDFYDNNSYGENGILFLLDMGSRQWYISTSGTAIELLSDQDLTDIGDRVIPYFSEGRFYSGFAVFLDILPKYLDNSNHSGINLLVSVLVGAVIALIGILIMRGSMNTKKPQRSAVSYEVEGSYRLHAHQDLFLYSNISKREKPKNNSSTSSTHRSASGRSHGGGGGKF